MKMFTRLVRLTMALLLMSAIIVVQAQSGKHLSKDLTSDKVVTNKVQVMKNTKDINPAADVAVEGFIAGPVSEVNTDVDLSKIGSYGESSKGVLYNNGPIVTNVGGGFGGADLSALQTALGLNTLGGNGNHNVSPGNYFYFADDFTATATWTISAMKFYGYQTGSTTTSTFTGVYVQIWNGDPSLPASAVVFGDLTTNRIISTTWTNAYRASDAAPTGNTRPVMEVLADMTGCILPAGTYWVQMGLTGSLASGPWCPPISILGTTVTGNAQQKSQYRLDSLP
jgi:hypothetical protein